MNNFVEWNKLNSDFERFGSLLFVDLGDQDSCMLWLEYGPFGTNSSQCMTIHCSDHCESVVPSILDQCGHEESISGIYLIIRGRLGGVLVALPPQGNALVAQSRARDMSSARRWESNQNTTKTISDDQIHRRQKWTRTPQNTSRMALVWVLLALVSVCSVLYLLKWYGEGS